MSATHKKVIVRLLNGTLHWGYLPGGGLLAGDDIELLIPDGRTLLTPAAGVRYVAYVRDFNMDDTMDPERVGLRSFPSKPRAGLWVRVQFPEGDTLEGVAHGTGLAFLDAVLLDRGIFLEPPNPRGNTLRLFIPRSAMADFEILGVPGSASAAKRRPGQTAQRQGGLFDVSGEP